MIQGSKKIKRFFNLESEMDSVVKSEPLDSDEAAVRGQGHKGHSRSKSQTLISFSGATDDELMKHFERSLESSKTPNHSKSKSLPRPMRGFEFHLKSTLKKFQKFSNFFGVKDFFS